MCIEIKKIMYIYVNWEQGVILDIKKLRTNIYIYIYTYERIGLL